MKRRDFIVASTTALAVTAVMPTAAVEKSWRDMTPDELTRYTLQKRQAGIRSNYLETHECPKCGQSYLCPDRYFQPSCGPSDWAAKLGGTAKMMRCLPCNTSQDDIRELWYQAHGIEWAWTAFEVEA